MSPRKLGSKKARTPQLSDGWGVVKWFLFSMVIGGVAGSAAAFEYYRSISPLEEVPFSVATDQPIYPTAPISAIRIPSRGSEIISTPVPSSTPIPTSAPPTIVEPAPTPTPMLTLGQIFAMNDRGEISDAEAKRLVLHAQDLTDVRARSQLMGQWPGIEKAGAMPSALNLEGSRDTEDACPDDQDVRMSIHGSSLRWT